MSESTSANGYLHTTTPNPEQRELLNTVIIANLAALRSAFWSYSWRVGQLNQALESGIVALQRNIREKHSDEEDPRVSEYFSRKFGQQLRSTVEAGAIVLVHSLLDGLMTRLLGTLVLHDTEHWQERILKNAKKEYSLQDALRTDWYVAFDRATDSYIRRVGRESVIEKNEMLFSEFTASAKGSAEKLLLPGDNCLKSFDRYRHQIVHEDALIKSSYPNAINDAGIILDHALAMLYATAETVGVPRTIIYEQMSALDMEGVAAPLTEEHLQEIEIPVHPAADGSLTS
jgi:hypothetical protein